MDGDDQKAIHLWLTLGDKIVALARVRAAIEHFGASLIDTRGTGVCQGLL